MKKTKNKKPRCSEETDQSYSRGVSPEAGRESMVGKICENEEVEQRLGYEDTEVGWL